MKEALDYKQKQEALRQLEVLHKFDHKQVLVHTKQEVLLRMEQNYKLEEERPQLELYCKLEERYLLWEEPFLMGEEAYHLQLVGLKDHFVAGFEVLQWQD